MEQISESEFEAKTKEGLVVVDFFATWCGPCRMMSSVLEDVEQTNPNFKILKVDVDQNQNLARRFGVMSIPTIVIMKNGEMVERRVGVVQGDDLIDLVKSYE